MTEDARDAKSMIATLFWAGAALVAGGIATATFADPITGGSPETLVAVGYAIAALASPALTIGVTAYAVSLGVRASR